MDSPQEDIGSRKAPDVPRDIQKARAFTAHVLRVCTGKTVAEQIQIEREGYRELHQEYPEQGLDQILRSDKRFHA